MMLPPSKEFKVVVVVDDPSLREVIQASFAAGGGEVEDSDTCASVTEQQTREIVMLDVTTCGVSAVEMCRQIGTLTPPSVGIVMVRVCDSEKTKAPGSKTVNREFSGEFETGHRRIQAAGGEVLQIGDLKLDLERHIVTKRGRQIRLSPKESDLLACLMKNPGTPLSHVILLRAVWGHEYGSEIEYLTSYIRSLRKKIEDEPARPAYILTEDWVGYRFRDPFEPLLSGDGEVPRSCDVVP
jgi:two-component system, OmpR family, KDP operon response regulator KdpE